jgi:hypothetical protein
MATIRPFNQAASDFLTDIARVFPEDTFVAQAKHLVDTAVKINEATVLPMVSFVGTGAPVEAELVEINRTIFEIPTDHFSGLYAGLNDTNKEIIDKYMRNMAILAVRADQEVKDMATRVRELKETQAFKEFEGLVQNPQQILGMLQNPSELGQMMESVLSNPELKGLTEGLQNMEFSPDMMGSLAQIGPLMSQMQGMGGLLGDSE